MKTFAETQKAQYEQAAKIANDQLAAKDAMPRKEAIARAAKTYKTTVRKAEAAVAELTTDELKGIANGIAGMPRGLKIEIAVKMIINAR